MTKEDLFAKLKQAQKDSWSYFYKLENITIPPAGLLVDFVNVKPHQKILDVACGTGVVALTAARKGAVVSGIDLSPLLIERAKENVRISENHIDFREGDVESLPYPDHSFDMVLSQFGHMFAPRPDIAISEMLRVLKPGGCIAFSTWPPELFVGASFKLLGKYLPSPPVEIPASTLWGEPKTICERLGERVTDIRFDRRINRPGFLSVKHAREIFESTLTSFCSKLAIDDPKKLALFRTEYETIISSYMKGNILEQHFLMTKAIKK